MKGRREKSSSLFLYTSMISKLALEIYEDRNCKTFTVKDISNYNLDIDVQCSQLLITPPGFGEVFSFDVSVGFHESFSSFDFKKGFKSECDQELLDLQDGIYQVRYQICPINKVNVEYNHLRQCKALNMYYENLCALELETCELSSIQKEKLKELKEIKSYLDAAKAYVEYCNSPKKGIELHNYAVDKLKKLNNKCKSCK